MRVRIWKLICTLSLVICKISVVTKIKRSWCGEVWSSIEIMKQYVHACMCERGQQR